MAEKIVSPGVFTQENDLSFVPQGVAEIGAALIGPTVKGPAGIPITVSNFSEYQTTFGTTFKSGSDTYEYFTSLAAEQYLQNSGQLTVVRILSGSYGPASASAPNTANFAGQDGIPTSESWSDNTAADHSQSFQIKTRADGAIMNSTGSLGSDGLLAEGTQDNLRWEISTIDKNTGTFTLMIRRGDDTHNQKVALETWSGLSLDPKSNNYIRKVIGDQYYTVQQAGTSDPYLQLTGDFSNKSNYIYISANQLTPDYLDNAGSYNSALTNDIGEYSASLPAPGTSGSFAAGSDGKFEAAAKFFENIADNNVQGYNPGEDASKYRDALYLLKNQDAYDINMIMMPGVTQENDSAITTLCKEVCEARGDCFFLVDPVVHGGDTPKAIATVTGKSEELITSYGAMYWPWVKIFAARLGQNVWVPASVVMGGVIAFNDKVAAEWYAPAGLNRGGVGAAIQAQRGLTHANRDDLYEARINPLATFPGQGVVVWGQKTLQKRATALDRVNVRRLLINLKKFIASTTKYLVFENNTSQTRNRFLSTVNPYMESVQQNQGLYAFKVIMDESNNTPDLIDRNIMKGEIFIQPAKAAEFIVVDFNIMPTGATFGE